MTDDAKDKAQIIELGDLIDKQLNAEGINPDNKTGFFVMTINKKNQVRCVSNLPRKLVISMMQAELEDYAKNPGAQTVVLPSDPKVN